MTDQPPYTPSPDDQAQLDALDAYLPLLGRLTKAIRDHFDAVTFLRHVLAAGNSQERDAAYQAQEATARAMQQAAQRVGDAIAKHELKLSRAQPDVVAGQTGAPRKRPGS